MEHQWLAACPDGRTGEKTSSFDFLSPFDINHAMPAVFKLQQLSVEKEKNLLDIYRETQGSGWVHDAEVHSFNSRFALGLFNPV